MPGKSHRQRSLAGYSPGSRKESDTTERLSTDRCTFIYYFLEAKEERVRKDEVTVSDVIMSANKKEGFAS